MLDFERKEKIISRMREVFNYKNVMSVPKLEKIVINMGLGKDYISSKNIKVLESGLLELSLITGQKPVITRAKLSIAAFKLREKDPIGVMVTLRGRRMYEFFERLVNIALPRVRDFRGVPAKSFDGRGNYTLGIKEQIMFPEIDITKVEKFRGMNVTFVTSARTDEEARELLACLGMPFRK
ncbi:50S ribosomal protein L5 [Chloracidobacterium validum]|uniref:Large ribosomal subunit protein uL5 n=1 Tax=Chloracidobacterium validum TaxID=2821543 RepID=A0ABX8BAP5_9BACT|nr:50S ribosomal protein L5 [Chloracidobacterium validum]QUW03482.1 50S ribosomal protein L5 [Chloracidobacterium validum]